MDDWQGVFKDMLYTTEELERREVDPRAFRLWLRRYVEQCQASGIVRGFKRGLPLLDMGYSMAPWFKQRCAMLGLDPHNGRIVGPEGRTSRPRSHSALMAGAVDTRGR